MWYLALAGACLKASDSELQLETKPFETSGGKKWGADQSTLVEAHKMLFLSAVDFGSAAYEPARKTQLKKLDPIYNKDCVLLWDLSV
jgi:hypothetical protein